MAAGVPMGRPFPPTPELVLSVLERPIIRNEYTGDTQVSDTALTSTGTDKSAVLVAAGMDPAEMSLVQGRRDPGGVSESRLRHNETGKIV